MNNDLAIIILNWNGREDTASCLDSLEAISPKTFSTIVVDNGSTDDSVAYFKQNYPNITLIETGENLGYAGGNNVGIEHALKQGFKYIMLLNNDTIVDKTFCDAFLSQFQKDSSLGILGATIYLMDEPTRLDHLGGVWNERDLVFDLVANRSEGPLKEDYQVDYVCGACMVVRREVFEEVGGFEPKFYLYWEESDLCFRAKRAGFKVGHCPDAVIWHKVSASFSGGKPHMTYFYFRNRLLWIERNIQGTKRLYYLAKLITSQLTHFYGLTVLRSLQKLIQKSFGKSTQRNQERLFRYQASLRGIHDYLFRRFGAGRSKKFINCQ